jgi:hypothetical protein
MIRKLMFVLATVATTGVVTIPVADARGFGGGGFHGGAGFHGGFHGGGLHGGGYRGWGPGFGVGLGFGLVGAGLYGAYGPGYYGYGPGYGGCYPRRVWTPYGWRLREFCG